ncbi:MAG TPA: hypothetical protein VF771_17965 [Longimicrobiaceae bacterium]
MSLYPLLVGVAATLVAGLQLTAWIGLGSLLLPRDERGPEGAALALLVGAALTGLALALLTLAGWVPVALAALAVADAVGLAVGRKRLAERMAAIRDVYRAAFAGRRLATAAAWGALALYWLNAIAPPRDADVMRYHLAHVRQILADGRWVPLPDYCYALPFGWSINYLGFERLALPQAAHLANLGVWLLVAAVVLEVFRRLSPSGRPSATALLALALVAAQPYVVKSATTAHADAYGMLAFAAAAAVAMRPTPLGFRQAALLGFAAWVGAQSRYQLVGLGVTATIFGALQLLRRRAGWAEARGFALGGALALAAALPFYLVNWVALGDPVWPLLVRRFNGLEAYRDRVADAANKGLIGAYTPGNIARNFVALLHDPTTFPIPLLAIAACAAGLLSRDPRLRRLGGLTTVFLLVWVATEPTLYPRFMLVITAAAPMVLGPVLARADARPALRRAVRGALGIAVAVLSALTLFYSLDSFRYVATGNEAEFHRATWFYPVYQWVNRTTPRDARFMVIVASGHSYYLDRPYRRADPWLSGIVDWTGIAGPDALYDVLRRGGYSYLIYNRADWSQPVGGPRMTQLIAALERRGLLQPVRDFKLQLVTSRVRNQSIPSTVSVLRVAPSPPPVAR